jgi:hypothetical protein
MYQRTSAIFRKIADNVRRQQTSAGAVRDGARCPPGYPTPSPLRCGLDIRRSLDIVRSISQNIQTNAVPRPITTIKNINVNAGAVSMFNIPHAVQAAYQRTSMTASV